MTAAGCKGLSPKLTDSAEHQAGTALLGQALPFCSCLHCCVEPLMCVGREGGNVVCVWWGCVLHAALLPSLSLIKQQRQHYHGQQLA